jgi:CheY-like chemotaxis protein
MFANHLEPPALIAGRPAPVPAEGPPLRVLIVEDNPDAAESLRLLLELLGHEVRVARTGIEGVRLAEEWGPAVVLSDIGLPGLDGFGVAEALRPSGARLIAITGYAGEEFRHRAFSCGYEEVLIKPADPDALVRLLTPPRDAR